METIKADLHNHLETNENKWDFNQVIDIANQRLGKKGILGIVNFEDHRWEHFVDKPGYERQKTKNLVYVPTKDIFLVRGQEIMTKQGEILVFGLSENLKYYKTLKDTLKQAKDIDENSIIILPHMYFINGTGNYFQKNEVLLKPVDAIEVFNGEAFYGNKKAQMFYDIIGEDYNLGCICSSDGNSTYEIGSSYTLLEQPNKEGLIDSLRKRIKNHKNSSSDKKHFSKKGCLLHGLEVLIGKIKN